MLWVLRELQEALALAALALLGFLLGRAVYGNPIRWVLDLVLAAALVAGIGVKLHLVSPGRKSPRGRDRFSQIFSLP